MISIFPVLTFHFIYSNIPAAPANGLYTSQLIWYSKACGSYNDFLDWGFLLTRKLLNKGFIMVMLTWLTVTEYLWPQICSVCRNHNLVLSPFMIYHRACENYVFLRCSLLNSHFVKGYLDIWYSSSFFVKGYLDIWYSSSFYHLVFKTWKHPSVWFPQNWTIAQFHPYLH